MGSPRGGNGCPGQRIEVGSRRGRPQSGARPGSYLNCDTTATQPSTRAFHGNPQGQGRGAAHRSRRGGGRQRHARPRCDRGRAYDTAGASPQPTSVKATETDFHIALSKKSFAPGKYTFDAVNKGQTTHALMITGPGIKNAMTKQISPGQEREAHRDLQEGRLRHRLPDSGPQDVGHEHHHRRRWRCWHSSSARQSAAS